MDNYLYQCRYCGNQYKPKRRHKQKYCSSSCRVNAFNRNKNLSLGSPTKETTTESNNPTKIEKMSFAGVGNAVAGTVVVNTFAHFLTKEENRPATKKDIKEIITALKQRYFKVKNMNPRSDGSLPYFDMQTSTIIYFKQNKNTGYGSV